MQQGATPASPYLHDAWRARSVPGGRVQGVVIVANSGGWERRLFSLSGANHLCPVGAAHNSPGEAHQSSNSLGVQDKRQPQDDSDTSFLEPPHRSRTPLFCSFSFLVEKAGIVAQPSWLSGRRASCLPSRSRAKAGRVPVAAKGGSAQLLPNARHACEGAAKTERSSWDDGNNRRRRRYPAANPSGSCRTNALRSRRGDRSTPKKVQKCLAMPWRTDERALVESLL